MFITTRSKPPTLASPSRARQCPPPLSFCPRVPHGAVKAEAWASPLGSQRLVRVDGTAISEAGEDGRRRRIQVAGAHPCLLSFPVSRQQTESFHICIAVWSPAPHVTSALVKALALLRRHPSLAASRSRAVTMSSRSTCTSPSLCLSVMLVPVSHLPPALRQSSPLPSPGLLSPSSSPLSSSLPTLPSPLFSSLLSPLL